MHHPFIKEDTFNSLSLSPLQVYIAQREFKDAVALIFRARKYIAANGGAQLSAHAQTGALAGAHARALTDAGDNAPSPALREASNKVEARAKHLLEILQNELKTNLGGPRAARRAVQLLVKMGRSTLATDLFLEHRSAILQSAMK